MAYAPIRRRCPVCRDMKVYKDPRNVVCSTECEHERREADGFYERFHIAGNTSLKRVSEQRLSTKLRALGASEEVISVACRARDHAYSAGHMRGKAMGYQRGWDDAKKSTYAGAAPQERIA